MICASRPVHILLHTDGFRLRLLMNRRGIYEGTSDDLLREGFLNVKISSAPSDNSMNSMIIGWHTSDLGELLCRF